MKPDAKKLAVGMVSIHGLDDALRIVKNSLETAKRSNVQENINFYNQVEQSLNVFKMIKGDKNDKSREI